MSQSGNSTGAKVPDLGRRGPAQRSGRIVKLTVAALASLLSVFLSWPYWRDFSYWAESRSMWALYFAVGFVLAVYVFYVFMGCLRTLFEHDALERAELAARPAALGTAAEEERS